ncbi:GNAT family N-acetyltransferase [Bacillus daqingensis]|uniref:GNAT family N-acetyltransferase n=1 Tax=Bacillus daqingensis TaxID=872396 RepID=A0ABV9NWZ3_9BACI
MEQLPEKNLFMVCHDPNRKAFAAFPDAVSVRSMQAADLQAWMAMPFDHPMDAEAYRPYMEEYVERVYGADMDRFFRQTAIVEDGEQMIGVCTRWKAYGKLDTVHWLKTVPDWEGRGIGRALMTQLLERAELPVYLHTQPESYRAVGLYTDLGFQLMEGDRFGTRLNHLEESLPYLKVKMKPELYAKLQVVKAPAAFVNIIREAETEEF